MFVSSSATSSPASRPPGSRDEAAATRCGSRSATSTRSRGGSCRSTRRSARARRRCLRGAACRRSPPSSSSLAGPLAAALVHCAVTLVRTENLVLADAWAGLRLHWRRGLVLGARARAVVALGVLAIRFYGGSPMWPLASSRSTSSSCSASTSCSSGRSRSPSRGRPFARSRARGVELVARQAARRSFSGSRCCSSTPSGSPRP